MIYIMKVTKLFKKAFVWYFTEAAKLYEYPHEI